MDYKFYLEIFNKKNKILKISNGLITIIYFSLTILIINLLFFTPEIHGYDEMAKWYAGKMFFENFEISSQHHSMRWGAWITTLFFQSFKNGPLAYYIHNLLVLHISLIIFAYIIFKFKGGGGIIPAIIFLFVTHYYDYILWSGFQADVSIFTFLPLSLIILLIQKNIFTNSRKFLKENLYLSFFTFICFYLYAVKETNLFFIPGILYFIFAYYGFKMCIKFILIFIFFYILETILFKFFIVGNFSNYGRIFEIIFRGTLEEVQKEYSSNINLSLLEIVINRWYHSGRGGIYLITLISFCYLFLKYYKVKIKKKFEIFIILTAASFYFFHTFFITSLNPLIPGQAFTYRYNLVIFPICTAFISILICNIFFSYKSNLLKIILILIVLFPLVPTLKNVAKGNKVLVRHALNNKELNNILLYESFAKRIKYYEKLKTLIKNRDYCFTSKLHPRIHAIPFILGYFQYTSIKYELYTNDGKWIISYKNQISECENFFDLDL